MGEHMKFIGKAFTPKELKALKIQFERPIRDTVISKDEILNLRISLETTHDVNEFLATI